MLHWEVSRLGNDLEATVSIEEILVCVRTLSHHRDNYPLYGLSMSLGRPACLRAALLTRRLKSRVDRTLMGESIICDVLMFGEEQSVMLPAGAISRTQNPTDN